ncbi:helix turn helix domain containing protein [Dickeya phage Amaethon]|nr:helix turn helix domain containing protein [Dickeya phage Amaethon]
MSNIKKAFEPIITLLTTALAENPKVKVADIIDEVTGLAAAKSGAGGGKATTFHRTEAGEVIGIKDYYFGTWMDPRVVEFSPKKSSASGFNSMSKEGTSNWTKQNAAHKKGKEELLAKLASGEVAQSDLAGLLQALEDARAVIIPQKDGYGFATLEEMLADSANRGLAV